MGIECVWKHRDGNCGGRKRKVGRGRQSKDGREEFKLGKSGGLGLGNKQTNKQTNVTHIHGPVAAVNAHTLKASGSVTQLVSQLL